MKLLHPFWYFTLAFGILSIVAATDDCPCRLDRDSKLFDQDFGLSLNPDDFLSTMMMPWATRSYFRPWRHMSAFEKKNLGSSVKTDKDKLQIIIDVQHFSPDEIIVKSSEDYVTVEAKHAEKPDEHGLVSRRFTRKYFLPKGTKLGDVVSELSSDGILIITCPKRGQGERSVPIMKTGPVREETKGKGDAQGSCKADNSCKKA